MRRLGVAALALTFLSGSGGIALAADQGTIPSRSDVRHARDEAAGKAADVAGVQAQLVVANQRLQDAAVRAERAAERFNGARWELQQARGEAKAARRHADIAAGDLSTQRAAYADTVVSTYESAPSLSALNAVANSDGITSVVSKVSAIKTANDALDSQYDAFRAASTLAGVAQDQADSAEARAQALATQARDARDRAKAAEAAALRESQAVAAEKGRLIKQLARLQHISVSLAEQRQQGLEQAAAEAAAEAAQQEQEQQQQQDQPSSDPTQESQHQGSNPPGPGPSRGPSDQPTQTPTHQPSHEPSDPPTQTPSDPPTSTPPTTPPPSNPPPSDPPPAPSGGASAAISFARAQIGEPYRWGAAGPDAWDCSGLTMGSWKAGGVSLPHYSVAQYTQSTAISSSDLRPGDLVFWGSSSSASSIYHVALYVGDGMIVHAPRTGEDVAEVSMYYWIPPNFFARP